MSKRNKNSPAAVTAVLGRDLEALRAVISAGADVNETDRDGRAALHQAAINGDVAAAKVLLSAGAKIDLGDAAGWTPLHYAAGGYHPAVAESLLEGGASVDAEDAHGNTPLFRAVFESRGRGDMVLLLRRSGADVNHVNRHGMSPARLASTIANYDVKQWLD